MDSTKNVFAIVELITFKYKNYDLPLNYLSSDIVDQLYIYIC